MLTAAEEAPSPALATRHARVIRLHADDDGVISLDQLVSGTVVASENVTALGPAQRLHGSGQNEFVPWQISVIT